jgi:hypothetical protein
MVGIGGIDQDTLFSISGEAAANYSVTLGTREEQNPYTAELAAIAMALESLPAGVCYRHITSPSLPGTPTGLSGPCSVLAAKEPYKRVAAYIRSEVFPRTTCGYNTTAQTKLSQYLQSVDSLRRSLGPWERGRRLRQPCGILRELRQM